MGTAWSHTVVQAVELKHQALVTHGFEDETSKDKMPDGSMSAKMLGAFSLGCMWLHVHMEGVKQGVGLLLSLFVCLIHVYMYVCVCTHSCMCLWRPEVSICCISQSLSTLFLKVRSLPEPQS